MILILFPFLLQAQDLNYLKSINNYIRHKDQTNFEKLEQEFEKNTDRASKAKMAFLLANSKLETVINQRSYYALYALTFYKGKNSKILEDSYLQVISIFYYQRNINKVKKYLKELKALKNLSLLTQMQIHYYTGLILASEKKHQEAIAYWHKYQDYFAEESLNTAIKQEIARSYLKSSLKNVPQISKKLYLDDVFLNGVKTIAQGFDEKDINKIIEKHKLKEQNSTLVGNILTSQNAYATPCSILTWLDESKQKLLTNENYFKHLEICAKKEKTNNKLIKTLNRMQLVGTQRLLRAYLANGKNACQDYLKSYQEIETLETQQFTTILSGLEKSCSEEEINKNIDFLMTVLQKAIQDDLNTENFAFFFSAKKFREAILSKAHLELFAKRPNLLITFWNNLTTDDPTLLKALKMNLNIPTQSREFVISNILSSKFEKKKKIQLIEKHNDLKSSKDLVIAALNDDVEPTQLLTRKCNTLNSIEKEVLLRHLIKSENNKKLASEYSCYAEMIDSNSLYKESIITNWTTDNQSYSVSPQGEFSKVINYIHNERSVDTVVTWQSELKQFSQIKSLKDIFKLRSAKKFKSESNSIKSIDQLMKTLTALKAKQSSLINHQWYNEKIQKKSMSYYNSSVAKLIQKIQKYFKGEQGQKDVLIKTVENWRIEV